MPISAIAVVKSAGSATATVAKTVSVGGVVKGAKFVAIQTEPLEVTENGTYTAPEGRAYTPVTVSVPDPYPWAAGRSF